MEWSDTPQEVIDEWIKACNCCPVCQNIPCEPVMQGSLCECKCECDYGMNGSEDDFEPEDW